MCVCVYENEGTLVAWRLGLFPLPPSLYRSLTHTHTHTHTLSLSLSPPPPLPTYRRNVSTRLVVLTEARVSVSLPTARTPGRTAPKPPHVGRCSGTESVTLSVTHEAVSLTRTSVPLRTPSAPPRECESSCTVHVNKYLPICRVLLRIYGLKVCFGPHPNERLRTTHTVHCGQVGGCGSI